MKAVVKADKYEPAFQRTFNQYVDHHEFIIEKESYDEFYLDECPTMK